jgi:archaellin
MPGRTHEAILFSKSTGLNDSYETTGPQYTADGATDIIACKNLTTTPEGKLIKVPDYNTVVSSGPVLAMTSGDRILCQKDGHLEEFNGNSCNLLTTSPAFLDGVIAKLITTPVDIRINNGSELYKYVTGSTSYSVLVLGAYKGPYTSQSFSRMPSFDSGFVFNSKLFITKDKFLSHSEDYYYDVWKNSSNYITSNSPILQSGQIPGCIITTHKNGVTGYFGTSINKFEKKFYPCEVLNGSLYSGLVSKIYDNAHVFMCTDGVYVLTADGKLINLTVTNTDHLDLLNTQYTTTVVIDGKYLAYGDLLCVEYDFVTKAISLRDTNTVNCSGIYKNIQYFGNSTGLVSFGTYPGISTLTTTVQLPYSDMGNSNTKQLRYLYFTGKITGSATLTIRNQYGNVVTKDISNLGYVQNHKISGIRLIKGQKLSVEITTQDGEFKLEELRSAFYICSSRN